MEPSDVLRAPAKLNLTLEVLGRRSDGLHGVRSVMVPIDLCDELRVEHRRGPFSFSCSVPELREGNLAERAFDALGLRDREIGVRLEKRIPTGAGMGGGSSDAAAVLLAASRGVFGAAPPVDYLGIARSLGSDVPFFLVETAALVEGTGERVTALGPVPPWHALIVKPPVSVATGWAYERIDAVARPSRARNASASLQLGEALQRGDFARVTSLLHNDFHDAYALETPEIARAIAMLREAGARNAMMTGSGSCVFSLTEGEAEARALAAAIPARDGYAIFTAAFWNGTAWRSAA